MEGSLEGALAAILLFGAFQICGVAAAFPLLPQESTGVRLLFGSVAGSLMLQWFPALFAFGFGFWPCCWPWGALGPACMEAAPKSFLLFPPCQRLWGPLGGKNSCYLSCSFVASLFF